MREQSARNWPSRASVCEREWGPVPAGFSDHAGDAEHYGGGVHLSCVEVERATGATTQQVVASLLAGSHSSYAWVGGGLATRATFEDVVLAFDLESHVPRGAKKPIGINVLFGDGHVDLVDERTAKTIRAQFVAGVRPIRVPPQTTAPRQ